MSELKAETITPDDVIETARRLSRLIDEHEKKFPGLRDSIEYRESGNNNSTDNNREEPTSQISIKHGY